MTVSGLVLTLENTLEAATFVIGRLHEDARITLGEPIANRVPIAAETTDAIGGEELVRELEAMPGVLRVDVISIDFSEATDGSP